MPSKDEARALNQKITPHLKNHPRKPAIPKSTSLGPLGTLSILPCELRDLIYGYVCNQEYSYWFNDRSSDSEFQYPGRSDCRKWEIETENLSMLQESKPIREEFLSVLCSEVVFKIGYSDKLQRNDVPFVNDISNIQLFLDLYPEIENGGLSTMKAEPVSFFTGTTVIRNTCVIELSWCTPKILLLLKSPLMSAMSQLMGFKTVRLIFSTDADDWLKHNTPQGVRETFRNLETCPGFDTVVFRISSALEPTLGSFTTGENLDGTQYVTFHPQSSPLKKAEGMEADAGFQMYKKSSALSTQNWTLSVRGAQA